MRELSLKEYKKHCLGGKGSVSIKSHYGEWVSEALSGSFELGYCEKGRWWYSEWEDRRRKVITLSDAKDMYQLWWGYNHDFIPELKKDGSLTYHRTEKSFAIDVFDDYNDHVLNGGNAESVFETRARYELPVYSDDENFAKQYVIETVKRNIPFMKQWFTRVKTVEDEIAELDELISSGIPDLYGWRYTKAFLLAKLGRRVEAEREIRRHYGIFPPPEKILEKLAKI